MAAEDVPPTAYAIPRANVYRDDTPEPSIPQGEALSNAPERRTAGSRCRGSSEATDDHGLWTDGLGARHQDRRG